MSFVTDISDIGVCPGFWINKKNGKVRSPGLQSPHIGYATLSQNVLGIHDDTASNGLSSEVIWIFSNHRNKRLKQLSLPSNSKLKSSVVYRCYVMRLRVYSKFQLLSSRELCYSLISAALLLCKAMWSNYFWPTGHITKRDNSRATSHKMMYEKQIDKLEKRKEVSEVCVSLKLLHNSNKNVLQINAMPVVEAPLTLSYLYQYQFVSGSKSETIGSASPDIRFLFWIWLAS